MISPRSKALRQKAAGSRFGDAGPRRPRPFWLPASSYYALSAAVAIALFFFLWGALHEGKDEMPWIGAGLGASIALAVAVFLREIILRGARERFLLKQKQLDHSLLRFAQYAPTAQSSRKLTLEQNSTVLREIRLKSDAAKVLARLPEGHREVFDLCESYLSVISNELPTIAPGSPRIPAFRRGGDVARKFHRYHLLKWAEIETRSLTQDARSDPDHSNRVDKAQEALSVLDFALAQYPNEASLNESRSVVEEMVGSFRVGHLVEQARFAVFKGRTEAAIELFEEAVFILQTDGGRSVDKVIAVEAIGKELDALRTTISSDRSIETSVIDDNGELHQ